MLTAAFRSFRTVAARQPVRAFSVSAARLSAAPPQLLGEVSPGRAKEEHQ
jgi:hypothetical protein